MERYNRQELVIGEKAQDKLNKSTVAIIGIGALGTTAANLLARAGVNLALFDIDTVELSNLQRQTIFTETDIGKSKALQAAIYLKKVNSSIKIKGYNTEINSKTIHILKQYNIILDCTDTMETRFIINDYCVKNKKAWILSSVIQSIGRMKIFLPNKACLRCLYSPTLLTQECGKCDKVGILNTIPSIMAAIQINECIKYLTQKKNCEDLIAYDVTKQLFEKIKINQKKNCTCCKKKRFEFI
ncbi:MAG: HesA/MoeB/ThiF family protein [Candidatus Woesearchaeota archaeon]|jgi:adenylyltransferase/sulfurtransferase